MAANETARALAQAAGHQVALEDCATLAATGVLAVLSCDEQSACLDTPCGVLTVGGEGLNVSELSVETGRVKITGQIAFLQYAPRREKGAGGLLRRLAR